MILMPTTNRGTNIGGFLARAWAWLRQVSGDAAYETYVRHSGQFAGGATSARPLTRAEFYVDSVRRRYSKVSRCC
jgi:uncharacterized short protein YbdD (DUF466 family)